MSGIWYHFFIIETIIEHKKFSSGTFWEWFTFPVVLVIVGFFIELPFYFIGKKHPELAKKLKKIGGWIAGIIIGGIIILAILSYFR